MMANLPVEHAELYKLSIPFSIPFTMNFEHATASRNACDSFIWVIRSGEHIGVGEAVFRDYVSGSFGDDAFSSAVEESRHVLNDILGQSASLESLQNLAADSSFPAPKLPVLCGVETAILDLLCKANSVDIYTLLDRLPVRETMTYGGTVPLLKPDTAKKIIGMYRELGIQNLRIKVGDSEKQITETIHIARTILGDGYDLRVDANGSWTEAEAMALIPVITDAGITIIEEPVGRNVELQTGLARSFPHVTFAADESILTVSDLKQMHEVDNFGMINIRLSKNGGLLRSLELADRANELGIRYQLGCQVGETGVLSAAGRVAASLMEKPEYVDGSYDRYLLSGNVTKEHVSFGPGGVAYAVRGKGLGYKAVIEEIERWSVDRKLCI